MRFFPDAPAIPDELLNRRDNGEVVFLCGAGVSIPSGMPDFIYLTKYVIKKLSAHENPEINKDIQSWLNDPKKAGKSLDQIFDLLYQKYRNDRVNSLVTEKLQVGTKVRKDGKNLGYEHDLIKRISADKTGSPLIVTTNFDTLFEEGKKKINWQVASQHAKLKKGITYLHGRINEGSPENQSLVLTGSDFGKAYISDNWAAQFIKKLLNSYTVVLIGYQAEDPPVNYLFRGLSQDKKYRNKLFAFDKGQPEDIKTKWGDKGITPIAYSSHIILWKTMEAWAERADNPKKWRASIILFAQNDYKKLSTIQLEKVTNVVSDFHGAKQFFDNEPQPLPEWISVLDAMVPKHEGVSKYYEIENTLSNYSGDNHNNILQDWLLRDHKPRGPFFKWISKLIHSPVMAWWVAKQNPLHPQLFDLLRNKLITTANLHERAQKIWNLILEYHKEFHYDKKEEDWCFLNKRIREEGWNPSVFQDFRKCSRPKLVIKRPESSLYTLREKDWNNICLSDIGFNVVFLNFPRGREPKVTDDALLQVFNTLEYQLNYASELLSRIEIYEFDTPTCYPNREMAGLENIYPLETARNLNFIKELFDRVVNKYHSFARKRVLTGAWEESFYFRKLKLYALSKSDLFNGIEAAEALLSLDLEVFWDKDVARELLFLIVDRWPKFSENNRKLIAERILSGPYQLSNETEEQYRLRSNKLVAIYCRYIQLKVSDLPQDINNRFDEIISIIPNWSDDWVTRFIDIGIIFTSSKVCEDPDELINLPDKEIIQKARAIKEQGNFNLPVKRPFKGLVQNNPRKALLALILESKVDCFPSEYWSDLIFGLPKIYSSTRLERIFLHRLKLLPPEVVFEIRYQLGPWVEQNFHSIVRFDDALGWSVYDHIADCILASRSVSGEISNVEDLDCVPTRQSIQNYRPQIDSSIVNFIEALFKVLKPLEGNELPDYIKTRLELFFKGNGKIFDHAVYACMRNLNLLMNIDPEWTKERLIPMMEFEHPSSELAWNSFLERGVLYSLPLNQEIKRLLVKLFPWINDNAWKNSKSETNAAILLNAIYLEYLNKLYGLTQTQMREAIRAMSHKTRNELIWWLGEEFLKKNNDDAEKIFDFIKEVWPKEKKYHTSSSTVAWIHLLSKAGGLIPEAYNVVKLHLTPVEMHSFPFHDFNYPIHMEQSIMSRFPKTTLDLLYRVILPNPTDPLSIRRLSEILNAIIEAEPKLEGDSRYTQLSKIAN